MSRRAVEVDGPPASAPYSRAVWSDETLYLSGVVGFGDDVAARLADAFAGADRSLKAAGLDREDVVKANVYLVDIGDFDELNAAYVRFFAPPLPARTTVAVAALPRGARVEIELIARRPAPARRRGFRELVDEAEQIVPTLDVTDAQALLGRDDVVFVDVRDVRELEREGRLPGAFHAPRGMLEFWIDPESPYHKPVFAQPEKRYVFFCAGGWRSALAARTAREMGIPFVAHLGGGFTDWKAAGAPVEPYVKKP